MKNTKYFLMLIAIAIFIMCGCKDNNTVALTTPTKQELDEKYASLWEEFAEEANTAEDADSLNQDEKDFIYYINLARLRPALFADTYLKDYEGEPDSKESEYFDECKKSLIEYLKAMEPSSNMIYPSNDLMGIAMGRLTNHNSISGGDTLFATDSTDHATHDYLGKDFNTLYYCWDTTESVIIPDVGFHIAMHSLIGDRGPKKNNFLERKRFLADGELLSSIDEELILGVAIKQPKTLTSVNKEITFAVTFLNKISHLEHIFSYKDILSTKKLYNKYASQWTEYDYKANTAKDVKYLNENEKEFFYYMNLVRLNPTLFADTYLRGYKGSGDRINRNKNFFLYKRELTKILKAMKPLEPIYPDVRLYKSAAKYLAAGIIKELDLDNHDYLGADFNKVHHIFYEFYGDEESKRKENLGFKLVMKCLMVPAKNELIRKRYLIDKPLIMGITIPPNTSGQEVIAVSNLEIKDSSETNNKNK